MKNTRIRIFNQLIDGDTPDSDKLKSIMKNHYKKFYLLYNTFLDLRIIEKVSTISCEIIDTSFIIFIVDFKSKLPKNINIQTELQKTLSEFNTDINIEQSHLVLRIKSTNV